ncbi:Hypothetical protein I595_1362 [Croceitalea dokdonensis DOKDO 023]|uniref:Uncharacterized protein n=1 Tax=Croceitalea dokdonensis DOKDO 023 TaxID=1300341 RepID=A0A0P7B1H6_9FLAO|nr:DUF6090 family protein [Croceitalea dokdonensis]KPM32935.1 Hypothetical protein I595_1362 [Croceitalea dokdonensis DOKDO 023]
MIKFFRRIRQELLSDGKFYKYLLYAVGEIVLVVIGILIALQIDSWNQDKKNRKLEQQYYCRLLEDVKQDYSNYEYSLELLNVRINANNIMIQKLLDDTLPLESITPNLLKSVKFSNRNYRATTDALEDIKSSGNLNILTDLSVKNKLASYYESMARTSSIIETNGKAITDKRFFESKDFVSSGWIKLAQQLNGIDTTKVDLDLLNSKVNFTAEIREIMLNDAMFYLGINARNKQILKSVENEILSMIELLNSKCQKPND